jgi:hypothetical protein
MVNKIPQEIDENQQVVYDLVKHTTGCRLDINRSVTL